MKSILVGSVISSQIVLEEMINLGFPIDMVFSLDEKYSNNVSGYRPIHEIAETHGIPYTKFHKIGDEENIKINNAYIVMVSVSYNGLYCC